ncbi:S41 family peptidase [Segnochrobactrum spirostomi]|uniref:S41 family peptidase n=1 Tax=Segnochrobactrum spirostomi TaxID=2608987 RepID=UPI001297C61F|nr:S41 family peptidase [Segnochrobactrum spirostomi]
MIRRFTLVGAGVVLGAALMLVATQPRFSPASIANAASASTDVYRQLNLFGDVFERIRSDYVDQPDDAKLVEAAIKSMLTSLDPHSEYLPPDKQRDMNVKTRGEFGGLGIQVLMENGAVKVVSPIEGTPAQKAGVLSGDVITAVDGKSLEGVTLDEAVDRLRGPINTPVTLTIKRANAEKPLEFKIVRDRIVIPSVHWRAEGDVGYIKVNEFTENTNDGLKNAIDELSKDIPKDKLKGYIIDLRNNPGGLFDQSIMVADDFLDRGEIVSTRGRDPDKIQRFNARSGDLTGGKPIIVLVNGGSASASEIVAGALQDHRRATILGTRSFGKGSVQTIIPLGSNGAIRLTTARYYTPSGRSIQAKGIEPDIEVVQDVPDNLKDKVEVKGEATRAGHLKAEDGKEQLAPSQAYVPEDPKQDKQLNTALELLRGLQANKNFPPNPETPVPN